MELDSPMTISSDPSVVAVTISSSPQEVRSSTSEARVAFPAVTGVESASNIETIEHVASSPRSQRSDSSEEIRLLEAREEAARLRLSAGDPMYGEQV